MIANFNPQQQHTLQNSFSLQGKGLHTGVTTTLTALPANANFGIQFQRIDLADQPTVKADCDFVSDTSRSTVLENKTAKISTVEHLLAALVASGVDNCLIQVDNIEIPILDGSAMPFIEAIEQAGIQEQAEQKKWYHIPEYLELNDAEKNAEMLLIPNDVYQIQTHIDFNSVVLGTQSASLSSLQHFKKDVASARTFCFLHELEILLQHNLIKGGDFDNAIVVVEKTPSQDSIEKLAKLFNKPSIKVEQGYLNNLELRYSNEPARHKLLDVLGDLALIGYPIQGKIIATRPGHKTNIAFAKKIKAYIKQNLLQEVPHYNPDEKPIYSTTEILKRLPHRFPFLLVDKIIDLKEKSIVGIKNSTFDEPFYVGHFPDNPIFPGVLQIEALAQTGGILALNTVPDPYNYDTYFVKIDQCKFKQKIGPGDTLILKMEFLEPIRRGLCIMKGTIFVGKKLCTEAVLVAQIIKTRNDEKSL